MSEKKTINYDDTTAIREVLVGRRIVEVRKSKGPASSSMRYGYGDYSIGYDHIEFVLDNGTILEAVESDGGCACSNGCFSVEQIDAAPNAVITNDEVVEEPDKYTTAEDLKEQIGSAVIKLFVYAEGRSPAEIVRSEGGDNGYYGWGFGLFVKEAPNE